jgi:PAS domain S-box-containing protein
MANEVLHRVLGYEYGELIGKTVYDIYPKAAHAKVKESLSQIIFKGFNKVVKGSMVTKSGEEVEAEMVSRALMDALEMPVGTITISRPVDMQLLIDRLPHT